MTEKEFEEKARKHLLWRDHKTENKALKDGEQADFRGENLIPFEYLEGFGGDSLSAALLEGATLPSAPAVENLDKKILHLLRTDEGQLDMNMYHDPYCGTTHCLAGWAITLAGVAGREFERDLGSGLAGALIYFHSTGLVPEFDCTNEEALRDLKQRVSDKSKD